MSEEREITFEATDTALQNPGRLLRPEGSESLLVLGHGAGAGMDHPFLESLARALAALGMASLRYQFPYMAAGRRLPDRGAVLQATARSAAAAAERLAPGLPVFAGGKSMGGRMTSLSASQEPLPGVSGLVFFGFPLHPAGKPGSERGEHLRDVELPMLFLQGTRDRLADLALLRPVIRGLGSRATLHVVEGGDHSFATLKRSGRSGDEILTELARTTIDWSRRVLGS